jgi:anti-sigma regulatory factor (Ser/Thr protein kinase)
MKTAKTPMMLMQRDVHQWSQYAVPTPPAVRIPLPSLEELWEATVAQPHPDDQPVHVSVDEPLALQLAPTPVTGPLARAFIAAALATRLPDAVVDSVLLLVSELVTNAIRHASSPARLELMIRETTVRVEVIDASPQPPLLQRPAGALSSEDGRGMFLVEALADRWGYELLESGKCVWFEVDLPDDCDGTTVTRRKDVC